MFVVSLTYVCDMSEVDKHLNSHIEYLNKQYSNGVFLASGRKEPRIGGVILARAESREALEQILSEDPFKIYGLASYEVTEFIPSKTSPELEFLVQ
ncbi:YciI family protein [Pseudoalteromonas sp. SG44-8]|uniref:YciI family protein n=1 Tax=Pseudoalteromonas sp. SG44-8 TaxID=2760958 RepID=UPI0016044C7B|nr:YciI family protein [Pseudoalteromonas sp. SG44-8]MBB1397254.1 GTP cyclohydrolase [Pseudoalteromonas sp. SG44-8]